jgi:hypothetical protein
MALAAACAQPKPVVNNLQRVSAAPNCSPRAALTFDPGLLELKAKLGDFMGDPLECASTNPANGDVIQHTTAGLAFVRKSTGMPTFTDGRQHWGLRDYLIKWGTGTPDPPAPRPSLPGRPAPIIPQVPSVPINPGVTMTAARDYLYQHWPMAAKRMDCVIFYESHWDPRALNASSGASGLAQFIPSTWARTPQGKEGKSPFDPIAAIDAFGWMVVNGGGSWGEWEVVHVGLC